MIVAKSLTKTYGLNPVLRGVDLSIEAGEFVVLAGANGAGKSTLMRIVSTLLKPTDGEITVGGWSLPTYANQVRQHIGYLSHQSLLYDDLSAAENLRFFARLYQIDASEEAVDAQLERFGLHWRRNDLVRTFSRGMTQRLALARATLHNPEVLLLDEPYTGLDVKATDSLDRLLIEQHEAKRTILMITHDLLHGVQLAQRVLMLRRGKIDRDFTTSETGEADILAAYREVIGR